MRRSASAVITLLALVLAACGQGGIGGGGTIKIGFGGPQTGEQAEFGKFTIQAVQLAVGEWNDKGGISGKKIELVVGDDRADPKETVLVAQKLIDSGIVAMIGPGNSGTFIPASVVFNEKKIPDIGAAVSNPTITERGLKYILRVNPRDDVLMPYAADYIYNKRSIRNAVVIHDKSAYGEGAATEFRDRFQKIGGQILLFEGTNLGDTDFTGVLTKVKGVKPQLLVCGCNHNHSGYVVRQAKQLGIEAVYLIGDSGPGFDEVAGAARTGVLTVQNLGPGDIPEAASFITNYTKKWGEPPAIYSHMYYAAAVLLFTALQTVGTDPDKVVEYLHGLKGFSSVYGTIEFDAKGDNVKAQIGMFEVPAAGYPYKVIDRRGQ